MNYRPHLVVVAAVTLLLVGSLQVLASAGPEGVESDTERWPDCATITFDGDGPELTAETLARSGATTTVASVERVDAAIWTTTSGKRPSFDEFQALHPQIIRPVALEIEDVLVGSVSSGDATWALLGGQVGCDVMAGHSWIEPSIGRYVVVGIPSLDDGRSTDMLVTDMWAIVGDTVTTSFGEVSLGSLRSELASAEP